MSRINLLSAKLALAMAAACYAPVATAQPLPAALICRPDKVIACGSERCEPMTAGSTLALSPQAGGYKRCDAQGCDTYAAEFAIGGAFLNATVPGKTMFFKMSPDLRYVETSSLMDVIYIFRGTCTGTEG